MTDANGTRNRTAGRSPDAKPFAVETTLTDWLTLLPTPQATRGGSTTETDYLLPTPQAADGERGSLTMVRGNFTLRGAVLLPTPVVTDASGTRNRTAGRSPDAKPFAVGTTLTDWLTLLPTPRATDGTKGGPNQAGSSGDLMLPSAITEQRFGSYGPAVRRWETLTRPAPEPREPGKNGQPRLAPRFVEWMMGLPDGWVTAVPGIGRNQQLKALGNGVVPQQAAEALRRWAVWQDSRRAVS